MYNSIWPPRRWLQTIGVYIRPSGRRFQIIRSIMVVLCNVNVRSLMAPGRLSDLQMLTSFNNIDILCITETWLKPNHLNSSIIIPGFQPPLRKDRLSSRGGGVAIYLRDGLAAKLLPLSPPRLECLSVQLHFPKRKKLTLHVVYRPPNLPMES